ncbi:MAG: TldD/PmbA family protein [Candidatus Saganbacteria bacterium]|nr:TldD/PmbA family protein [Candidatus Saganbacteria bacterium]
MSNGKNPKSILESILKKDLDQAEVYISSSKTLKITVLDQKVESINEIKEQGVGIRVIKDEKLGFAYTSDFNPDTLSDTIKLAIANAKSTNADKYNGFPTKETQRHSDTATSQHSNIELYDKKITQTSIEDKIKLALKMEAAAYKADKRVKKTEKISYSDSEISISIANSNGIEGHYRSNYCGGFCDVIAKHNGEMNSGFGFDFVKRLDDLKPQAVGAEAARRASQLLGAKSITSQKIPLVLDPYIGTQILEVLAAPLSSDAVQKGKSLFAKKLGLIVAAKLLTIIDNGKLKNGIESVPFDSEGVPTQETKLIEQGKLETFLYDTYTANKGDKKSTGNAVRASFATTPLVGVTNFYIQKNKHHPADMIKSIKKGLYVTRVMGMHTVNPISGDFSIGAAGIMIEKGAKTYPVRGITIAGNIIDMLEKIQEVGSDLRFIANIGAPTLLISGISVSGS